jgi:hypothetical protein
VTDRNTANEDHEGEDSNDAEDGLYTFLPRVAANNPDRQMVLDLDLPELLAQQPVAATPSVSTHGALRVAGQGGSSGRFMRALDTVQGRFGRGAL